MQKNYPFSFFLRDVDREWPIFLPAGNVAATAADDRRTLDQIRADITGKRLCTLLQETAHRDEQDYASASQGTRSIHANTWLGISRDARTFEFGLRNQGRDAMHFVKPQYGGSQHLPPQFTGKPYVYKFQVGPGMTCVEDIARRLDAGTLPILHVRQVEQGVTYDFTCFATLEKTQLKPKSVRGTHYLVADGHGYGHMFTPGQQAQFDKLKDGELRRDEETVFCLRCQAVNTSRAPAYAWFKAPQPVDADMVVNTSPHIRFDGRRGMSIFDFSQAPLAGIGGRTACCVCRVNGRPMEQEEVAILLKPGQQAAFEFLIPHSPIPVARAARLAKADLGALLDQCRAFWRVRLAKAARISLPEQRIDEMLHAGLLHLDLVTFGLQKGPLAPFIGVYCPIGSESSPIIQFMDSMGWADTAQRALDYFLAKQHDDGFIQNFGGYMLETGAALWSMGEHYRYTRDLAWVRRIKPNVLKACDYLQRWRRRNMREEIRGRAYGMIDGKVADPEDPFHAFMLNGYAYMGIARAAEMLAPLDQPAARRLAKLAADWRSDIRTSFFASVGRSPAVPLGDGTWVRTAPPWAEATGPACLLATGQKAHTHGSIAARDSLIGPLYLAFQEVLAPGEQIVTDMLDYHAELMHRRNVAPSQPYYSRHDWVHLCRGEVKQFLQAYYNALASLADRQTYTFSEHYHFVSNHKTHEEAWFLMQTRWMLYMERGQTLHLLPGVPKAWLASGKRIDVAGMASYFGKLEFHVASSADGKTIHATVQIDRPGECQAVQIRLPHPLGATATRCEGGRYDAQAQTVLVRPFKGNAKITLTF
jgi:hypothetical protein